MLDHVDSPYIRCIGFLYLRYAADPSILWEWFKPYLYDRETVKIRANVKCGEATVGNFVRDLLTELDYYGTRLPRFPVAVEREIRGKLKEEAIIEQRANRHMEDREALRYLERVGSKVQALYGDAENPVTWYNAVVDRVLKKDDATGVEFYRPKFVVTFFEYGNTETVTLGQMDMPGVDHSKPSPVGHDRHGSAARSMGHEDRDGSHSDRGRDCDRGYDRDFRDRPRDDLRNRSGGNRSNQRYASSSQGYGHDDRSHDRDRNSNRGYTDRQDYRRDKKQHRERSRSRDREPKETQARPPPKKTPEELAAIAQKKRKLLVKYG
jgi:pre-mRNA-splicing factor 38B